MLLFPAQVSSKRFTYDAVTRTFSGEISELNGCGRVWNDACDEGLTVVSSRTGKRVVFVITNEVRDADGDVLFWSLKSVGGDARGAYKMTVFND